MHINKKMVQKKVDLDIKLDYYNATITLDLLKLSDFLQDLPNDFYIS